MPPFQTKMTKASSSTGRNAPQKKDGYAAGDVPDAMIGAKPGKVEGAGYSGPNVTKASR